MTQEFIKAIESKTLNDNLVVSLNDEFFFSSLSACSLWLWHCLDIVCMLSYM